MCKLKTESFFSISNGVLELWRKNFGGGGADPSHGNDRVKTQSSVRVVNHQRLCHSDNPSKHGVISWFCCRIITNIRPCSGHCSCDSFNVNLNSPYFYQKLGQNISGHYFSFIHISCFIVG